MKLKSKWSRNQNEVIHWIHPTMNKTRCLSYTHSSFLDQNERNMLKQIRKQHIITTYVLYRMSHHNTYSLFIFNPVFDIERNLFWTYDTDIQYGNPVLMCWSIISKQCYQPKLICGNLQLINSTVARYSSFVIY